PELPTSEMKNPSGFVIPLALTLTALPALALVCDLRCESAGAKASRVIAKRPISEAAPDCCPAMADRNERRGPAHRSSGGVPCHGKRSGEVATLLSARQPSAALGSPQRVLPLAGFDSSSAAGDAFFARVPVRPLPGFRALRP